MNTPIMSRSIKVLAAAAFVIPAGIRAFWAFATPGWQSGLVAIGAIAVFTLLSAAPPLVALLIASYSQREGRLAAVVATWTSAVVSILVMAGANVADIVIALRDPSLTPFLTLPAAGFTALGVPILFAFSYAAGYFMERRVAV